MGCCCAEVRKYTNQLSKLKKSKEIINSAIDNSNYTKDYMNKSGEKFKSGIILNKAELSIGEELCEGYNDAVSQCNEAYEEVIRAIETVSDKLQRYKEQDRRWHSRKHHRK